MTNRLWNDLQHHLLRIHPNPINNLEKCFGIHGNTPNVILRNYLTFLLRKCISDHESIAYYNKKGFTNELLIKKAYNKTVKSEVWKKFNIFSNLKREEQFKKIFAVNDYLITWDNEQWQILTLY